MKKIICNGTIVILLILSSCGKRQKIGFINTAELFNGFEYKKEIEKELTAIKNSRKFILDSMEANLKVLGKQINNDKKDRELLNKFKMLREDFLARRQKFEDDEETMVRQFDEKIIKQLNSFTKQYGEENNYDMIYGANAGGNIMYADSAYDLTKEVTAYMNQKFSGK
jgi:outer membrane protein